LVLLWLLQPKEKLLIVPSDSGHTEDISKNFTKEAYATMLTSNEPTDDLENGYFLSARLVVSRLKHHPRIRTTKDVIG
jgi:hypothetical protein